MESTLRYKKMTGFATTDGQQLEVNLAALLFLRGLNSGLEFQLGTNVAGAGALDDVVFRLKPSCESETWPTLYVQLKYKASRSVNRTMLTNPKGDFSLPKYFKSYRDIEKAVSKAEQGTLLDGSFEESAFVIYTNAKASEALGKECHEASSRVEEFVWCGKGKVLSFEGDEDILKCLGKSGDAGNAFLSRLRVLSGQPDAKGLEAAIEIELRKVDSEIIQGVDCQSLSSCFLRRMKVWWETSSEVLHRGNDLLRASVLEVISQQTEKKYRLDLDFEEAVLDRLRDSVAGDGRVVHVQSSESSCRLSLTKLCQAFGGQSLVLDAEGLLANKGALLAQRRKGGKILIICTNGWSSSLQVDCFNVVKDLQAVPDAPTIVLLNASCAARALTDGFQEFAESYVDEFLFSQLKAESRQKVLATEVSLQGHSTTLNKLLNDTPDAADRVVDAFSVVEILVHDGSLTLGSAFGEGIGFYVDRHLEQATVVKDTVFHDVYLRGSVTVRVMQCETSADIGLDKGNVQESSGLPQVSATENRAGLFDKAVSFLSSINDYESLFSINSTQLVSNLSKSLLVADKDDLEVFIGPRFVFKLFECCSVGLRFGQQNAVTALRVRFRRHSAPEAGFLFVSDKTSESDARKLSDFHQTTHWLTLEKGMLRWTRSRQDIEAIRPHIDKGQVSTFAPENVMDVEDRLVLVCAEPGMGKSTLMARLARNTKEAHPHHLVFLIALNDHFRLFAQDRHKDELEFLCNANKITSHLHRSLLKYALEVSGNVIMLFDGYDEIAPKYVEQSCNLLASLVDKTKAKNIWMTSRNSIKTTLENRISKFSTALLKFDEEDQISFVKRFWAAKSELGGKELVAFIKLLLEKTSQAVRDKEKDFMGIPLQTQMLAEVYEDHVTGSAGEVKLPDKLDLLVLMDQFVDKKFHVYFQAKLKISPDSPSYEEQLESCRKSYIESHSIAGLVLILGDDIIKIKYTQLTINNTLKLFDKINRGEDKTGFIDSTVDDKPRFVHRVFAEYFVAKWISNYFPDYQELITSKMYTPDFAVVRNVFDRMLAKDCVLHTAVINEDLEEVRTLLEQEDVDVAAKDGGGRTALHLAASLGTSEDREENKRRGEILDLLISKTRNLDQVDDVLGGSPLQYADVTGSWVAFDRFKPRTNNEQFSLAFKDVAHRGMLDAVLNFDLPNLLGHCLDNGLEVEHCSDGKSRLLSRACEQGSLEVVSLLLERNADINAAYNDSKSPLHKASSNGHIEVVKLLHQHFIKSLGNAPDQTLSKTQQLQLANYINVTDKDGRTAIYVAARKGHSHVITALVGLGGDQLSSNPDDNTPLHAAAGLKHPGALRVLLEALDESDRAEAVSLENNAGFTVLMLGAFRGCLECVKLIVKADKKLTRANDNGITPLMAAAYEGHQKVVSYLLNNFNAEREGMSRRDYVNMEQKGGWTAIHVAARNGHSHVISTLIGQGGDPRIRNNHNSTPLHDAADLKHPAVVRVLLEALDEADRAQAVDVKDNDGDTALMLGAWGGCVECVGLIVKAGGKLTQVDNYGRTPLIAAAYEGHLDVVSYLLNNFNAEREGMSRQDYISMEQKGGCTAIHVAARNGHSHVVSTLIGQGGDPRSSNYHDSTPLHDAAELKHPAVVRVLLEAGRADVHLRNGVGNSVLMCGALGGCVECVALIVKAGGMLSETNYDGRTPLMAAAEKGNLSVVEYLLGEFDPVREGMTKLAYVHAVDKDGNTAMDLASSECRDVLQAFLMSLVD